MNRGCKDVNCGCRDMNRDCRDMNRGCEDVNRGRKDVNRDRKRRRNTEENRIEQLNNLSGLGKAVYPDLLSFSKSAITRSGTSHHSPPER